MSCFVKTIPGTHTGWKARVDPATASCPEVWKLSFREAIYQKVRNPRLTRANEKGY